MTFREFRDALEGLSEEHQYAVRRVEGNLVVVCACATVVGGSLGKSSTDLLREAAEMCKTENGGEAACEYIAKAIEILRSEG